MAGGVADRTGVLVVRVWIENGQALLRARITGRLDVGRDDEMTTVVAGAQAAAAAVGRWLDEFERGTSLASTDSPAPNRDADVTPG